MTDDEIEKIIKQNMNLQMNLAGIRADFEEATKRPWIKLTKKEKQGFSAMLDHTEDFPVFEAIEALLKEKNK